MIKLSIIIPYYSAKKYTDELLSCLEKQITNEVEVILIDDGSPIPYETRRKWVHLYRKANGGCSTARNYGLDIAKGEYIQFIDADDLVPEYFIEKLLETFPKNADVIDFSWKALSSEGPQHNYHLKSENDRLPNPSVCTRCFKRSYIGNVRFNEEKDSTEDEDFSRKLGYLDREDPHIHTAIVDYMYYYRTAVSNSKIKRFKKGLMNTKRVVYYYNHVTKDMKWLLDEIKKEDKHNEVWLLTNQNDIPELKKYCQVSKPIAIWGHYFKGEPYTKFHQIELPIKKQVVMYIEYASLFGGITTAMYNWAHYMKSHYDILIVYDKLDPRQVDKISSEAPIMKNDIHKNIICDTLIMNRINEKIPPNISYRKSIQICHACIQRVMKIPTDRDYLVNVSQAAKDSWGESSKNGIVIHNFFYERSNELFLVSATRMQVSDKGKNDNRFRQLAEMLNEAGIPFVWLNFSDKQLADPPKNFINMDARLNIQSFIKRADYLVQLSDQEALSMSILEALSMNTAVLATPFPSLFEEGFIDGKTGYAIPFDMKFDVTKLLNVPKFEFKYDNESLVKQWQKLLDTDGPGMRYGCVDFKEPQVVKEPYIKVKVIRSFRDAHTGKMITVGRTTLPESRVNEILQTQMSKGIKLIEVMK